jgi:hypothetical protein
VIQPGKMLGFKPDNEVAAALEDLSKRLGTENLSEVIRIAIMSGYKELNFLPEQLVRQSRREGILQGVAAFKENLESMIAKTLEDIT